MSGWYACAIEENEDKHGSSETGKKALFEYSHQNDWVHDSAWTVNQPS